MADFTVADVKKLREKTGAGMMDAKKALSEAGGDIEAAVDALRAKGLATAQKKSSRTAAEGLVGVAVEGTRGVAVEVAEPYAATTVDSEKVVTASMLDAMIDRRLSTASAPTFSAHALGTH